MNLLANPSLNKGGWLELFVAGCIYGRYVAIKRRNVSVPNKGKSKMEKLAGYQHAAEVIVQLVYGLVFLSVLAAVVVGSWILFRKRADKSLNVKGD